MSVPITFTQSPWYKTACWTCRDRKVKCDKVLPCRNCTVAGIVCSYPPQVRTVRRPKKAQNRSSPKQDGLLLKRIEMLEGLLKKQSPELRLDNVGGHAEMKLDETCGEQDEETGHDTSISPTDSQTQNPTSLKSLPDQAASGQYQGLTTSPIDATELLWMLSPSPGASKTRREETAGGAEEAGYWKRIEEECASEVFLKTPPITTASSKSGSSGQKHARAYSFQDSCIQGAFPFQGANGPMQAPLLSMAQRQVCWKRYCESVDPILKILHKSTTQDLVMRRDEHCSSLDSPSRALIQAVCLLAVTSMSDADLEANFESDKESVMRHCASLTEQALVSAKFLEAQDLSTIQALLLFLYHLRCVNDPRLNAMCGMAIFLAVRAGLNRDSAASGLSCLEVELRRRTWWQLVNLVDHPDDYGLDILPSSIGADTRLPLNVNDDELGSHVVNPGEERTGFTETSFSLMQYEVTRTFNRIKFERARVPVGRKFMIEEAEKHLHSSRESIRNKYLQGNVKETSVAEYGADVIAMILVKRRILMYISPDRNRQNEVLPPDAQDHLFLLAVHVLELSRNLQTNPSSERWRWLSATYFQWSITAFVVRNLTIRPSSPATSRAWRAVDGLLDHWPGAVRNCAKANALRGLLADAIRAREAQNLWGLHLSTWPDCDMGSFPPGLARHEAATKGRWTEPHSNNERSTSVNPPQQPSATPLLNQAMGFESFGASDFDFDELASGMDLGRIW